MFKVAGYSLLMSCYFCVCRPSPTLVFVKYARSTAWSKPSADGASRSELIKQVLLCSKADSADEKETCIRRPPCEKIHRQCKELLGTIAWLRCPHRVSSHLISLGPCGDEKRLLKVGLSQS